MGSLTGYCEQSADTAFFTQAGQGSVGTEKSPVEVILDQIAKQEKKVSQFQDGLALQNATSRSVSVSNGSANEILRKSAAVRSSEILQR